MDVIKILVFDSFCIGLEDKADLFLANISFLHRNCNHSK